MDSPIELSALTNVVACFDKEESLDDSFPSFVLFPSGPQINERSGALLGTFQHVLLFPFPFCCTKERSGT